MKIDFRLALPALVSWITLALILLCLPNHQDIATTISWLVVLLSLFGAVFVRRIPTVSFALLATGAVCLSLLIQLPFHQDTPSWMKFSGDTPGTDDWATLLREQLTHISRDYPGVGGQLIPGLSVGDTSSLSPALNEAMKTVSLSHITAVSGANCIIVTAGVALIAGWCGAGRRLRIVCGVAALAAFVVLVTPQPSVLRAGVMALLVLFARFMGRPSAGIPLLAVAVLVLLMWNPWWALEYGFILSVLAVSGLLILSDPLTQSLSRWMPQQLAALISLPLAAQLMCQPVIVLLSPTVPVYGVIANVVAAPAAPLATVCGLAACIVLSFAPLLAHALLFCAWIPAQWIGSTAEFLSGLPYSSVPWFNGIIGSLLAALVSLLFVFILLHRSPRKRRFAVVSLAVMTLVSATLLWLPKISSTPLPANWSIATCDVGQGDALILKSEKAIAAIDVGRYPKLFSQCLNELGIKHLDVLVLTHFDKDHVGGLSAVRGKVSRVISGRPENIEDEQILKDLASHGAHIERGTRGMSGTLGKAQWKILWPSSGRRDMQVGNPGSITLYVEFPQFSAIFLGDLGEESQRALMSEQHIGRVDVVKVAHHGSADQYSRLYEQLSPQISLLSVGAENDYGHPRQKTLDMLIDIHSISPRTDQDGLILITANTSGLSVWTEH